MCMGYGLAATGTRDASVRACPEGSGARRGSCVQAVVLLGDCAAVVQRHWLTNEGYTY